MKNFMIFLILIFIVATFLAITNPTKDDFISWGVEQIRAESETDFEKILGGVVGEQVLKINTTRINYVVFSIYKVDNDDDNARYIGIIDKFLQLNN
ncbi:MAG: DUF4359 domain-containing protein [Halanaerobiales bacterium]|nr:DUF4359 domain-containing protein [Halanaerobiales bacterium]